MNFVSEKDPIKLLQLKCTILDKIFIACIYTFIYVLPAWIIGKIVLWLKHGDWSLPILPNCYFFGLSCHPSQSGWSGYDQIYDFLMQSSLPTMILLCSIIILITTNMIRGSYQKKLTRLIEFKYNQQ